MESLTRIDIDIDALEATFCLGVAGNFAGHLQQAGEAVDFTNVEAAAAMPKGIFPWHVPGAGSQLGIFPLSSDHLRVPPPPGDAPLRIQIEPELGVLCDIARGEDGDVIALTPRWVAAFDDCSLRRPNAAKISDKKNWGAGSKGLAPTGFAVSNVDPAGSLASLRLACMLVRDGVSHTYGIDSAASSYMLAGAPLLAWIIDRLAHQRGSNDTPLEDVGAMLRSCPSASTVLIGVGATRYETYGETTFVEPGDEAIVALYDSSVHSPADVSRAIADGREHELASASVLRRIACGAAQLQQ